MIKRGVQAASSGPRRVYKRAASHDIRERARDGRGLHTPYAKYILLIK